MPARLTVYCEDTQEQECQEGIFLSVHGKNNSHTSGTFDEVWCGLQKSAGMSQEKLSFNAEGQPNFF